MKLIFLHAHKHQNYLQDDITIFGGRGQACSNN